MSASGGKVSAPGCASKPSRSWRGARRSQALQQNKAYNPFSARSKQMIQDVGNVELFELFETDPKTQCKACLSYWSEGILYCTWRASLERNRGQSKFHCVYAGPSFNSRIRNQEGKTSWPQIWENSKKERIPYGP